MIQHKSPIHNGGTVGRISRKYPVLCALTEPRGVCNLHSLLDSCWHCHATSNSVPLPWSRKHGPENRWQSRWLTVRVRASAASDRTVEGTVRGGSRASHATGTVRAGRVAQVDIRRSSDRHSRVWSADDPSRDPTAQGRDRLACHRAGVEDRLPELGSHLAVGREDAAFAGPSLLEGPTMGQPRSA